MMKIQSWEARHLVFWLANECVVRLLEAVSDRLCDVRVVERVSYDVTVQVLRGVDRSLAPAVAIKHGVVGVGWLVLQNSQTNLM